MAAESASLAEKGKQKASGVIRLWHAVREASCAWAGRSFIQTSAYEQFSAGLLQPDRGYSTRGADEKAEYRALNCQSPASPSAMSHEGPQR